MTQFRGGKNNPREEKKQSTGGKKTIHGRKKNNPREEKKQSTNRDGCAFGTGVMAVTAAEENCVFFIPQQTTTR
jgi:hypothetical protein